MSVVAWLGMMSRLVSILALYITNGQVYVRISPGYRCVWAGAVACRVIVWYGVVVEWWLVELAVFSRRLALGR